MFAGMYSEAWNVSLCIVATLPVWRICPSLIWKVKVYIFLQSWSSLSLNIFAIIHALFTEGINCADGVVYFVNFSDQTCKCHFSQKLPFSQLSFMYFCILYISYSYVDVHLLLWSTCSAFNYMFYNRVEPFSSGDQNQTISLPHLCMGFNYWKLRQVHCHPAKICYQSYNTLSSDNTQS